ncbi:MAG: DUF5615 family PIN-like protein [Planctomycetota bacterium]
MKFLLDTCVAKSAKDFLESAGHDVVWTGESDEDPGDERILARANEEGRVLVTLDKDFGELAVVGEKPHRGIVRLVGLATSRQGWAANAAADRYAQELHAGAIVTVTPERVRIRPGERKD